MYDFLVSFSLYIQVWGPCVILPGTYVLGCVCVCVFGTVRLVGS